MQLPLKQAPKAHHLTDEDSFTPRAIECDDFPFEELSRIAEAESWRKEIYRPIYHIHKWWAQRLGSVFRAIVLGSLAPKGSNVLSLFYSDARWRDTVVFDPFMGSGTTLGEVLKLGGHAIGRDINPVSHLQVQTALTMRDPEVLKKAFHEIEHDVAEAISSYYTTYLPDGTLSRVLYYFWVMQAPCPGCKHQVDLFSRYIFARHAYARLNPTVKIVCPECGTISSDDYRVSQFTCGQCNHTFDATKGPASGKTATCPQCSRAFVIGHTIRRTGSSPSYRMYAKLVLTSEGKKEYHPITKHDQALYRKAVAELQRSPHPIPQGTIEPGYNTNQVLNYGFQAWHQMFNARQLLCLSLLADRIKAIEDRSLRYAFTCLFSGVLEFNNMFASYKGEGTGAVRHMFYHHILKPERTPLEANIWGTPKSSGAFSTLFTSRLLRAAKYAQRPFELKLPQNAGKPTTKVDSINEPLVGLTNSESYKQFAEGQKLYVSCGDSSTTDLPDKSIDAVITDPPFFDNVHYSQLADFFYVWQKQILGELPYYQANSTRSPAEVQNADAHAFTTQLGSVFRECARVLKDKGLLVFTYHHSRWEGWRSVLKAVLAGGFRIEACHPVKAEMSVATPKHQAKAPIDFDVIMVCRKKRRESARATFDSDLALGAALEKAEAQVRRLRNSAWDLSLNDVGVIVMAQVIAEISRQSTDGVAEGLFQAIEDPVRQAIARMYESGLPDAEAELENRLQYASG